MAGKHNRPCLRPNCRNHVSYRRVKQLATLCGPCTTLLQRDREEKAIDPAVLKRKLVLP